MQPEFLITGDYQHADFSEVRASLKGNSIELPSERLWGLTEQNKARLKLVVIAESRRDQVTRRLVDSIRDTIPLARILIVQNDWCTGKKLPEQRIPGVIYRYAHQWNTLLQRHLSGGTTRSVVFQLPDTANRVDRQLFLAKETKPELNGRGIGIFSSCYDSFDTIANAAEILGATSFWIQCAEPLQQVDCIVVNDSTIRGVDYGAIERLQSETNAPIVLVANFPRQTDRERAAACGIVQVVPQPFLLEQFQFAIQSAIRACQPDLTSLKKRTVIQ